MGTHPIFESDFDCLTEKLGNQKAELRIGIMEKCLSIQRYGVLFASGINIMH